MRIHDSSYTSLWFDESSQQIRYIDQTRLPGELVIREMNTLADGIRAIRDMEVRGAPLIGVAAAFAMYRAARESATPEAFHVAAAALAATRPTAVNLRWAVGRMTAILAAHPGALPRDAAPALLREALAIRSEELERSLRIGQTGLELIRRKAAQNEGRPLNILTHCNAGWLATVDYGTALAPIYLAHDAGIPVHVWVDETRPRNQGAKLTAYELSGHGVPNTLIVDNAGGLLMRQGKVDMVIVGADRITANGDVINKIGTYLKALAAADNGIPFYVAAPPSTFDADTISGNDVTIEERSPDEILLDDRGNPIAAPGTRAHNPAFDITPARFVTDFWR